MLIQVGVAMIVWYNLDSLGRVSMRGCLLGQPVDMHVEDCLSYINTCERTQPAVSITVLEKGNPELFEMGELSRARAKKQVSMDAAISLCDVAVMCPAVQSPTLLAWAVR